MAIVTFSPTTAGETGTVNAGGGVAFDIGAALVSGGGVITVDSVATPLLYQALLRYPGLYVSGSTPGTPARADVIGAAIAHSGVAPAPGDILVRGNDGLFVPLQQLPPAQLPSSAANGASLPVPAVGSRLWTFGHSWLSGGGATHVDRQFITLLAGLLRSDLRDLGVGGSLAAADESWLPNETSGGALGAGGHVYLLQSVVPYRAGAPYTPGVNYLPLVLTGLNDLIQHIHDGSGSPVAIFTEAVRTHLSRLCASKVYEEGDASIALGGGTWQAVKADTNKNSGSGYQPIPANGATITWTIPADFEGGTVALGLTAWPASDGQLAFTGTASQLPATKSLSGLAYAAGGTGSSRNSSNSIVIRVSGLLASDAGKTIIATYSGGAGTRFATPTAIGAITQGGTGGAVTYTYERVYRTYNGDTLPSATTSTATGNATLSGTNFNILPIGPAWPSGVEAELVIRTVGGATQGVISTLTAGPAIVNDTGLAATAYAANSANPLTGGAALDYLQIESNNPATKIGLFNIATMPAATMTANSIAAANIVSYNAALTALAAEFTDVAAQIKIIDVDTALGALPGNFAASPSVHPNDRGHAIIADTARSTLQAWAAGLSSVELAYQSRVAKRVVGRAMVTSPLTGTLWGTAGLYTLTGAWTDIDNTNLLVAIDAQVGDDIEVTLAGTWGPQAVGSNIDACTCNGNAANVINYFASGGPSPCLLGNPGWAGNGTAAQFLPITGSITYTVRAVDIQVRNTVPGVVIVKLRGFGNTRTLYAGASGLPLQMHVKNLGPRNTPGFNAS